MARPRLMLLDEPSLGLSPKMVQILFEAIGEIASMGLSILIVEQNAQAVFSVAQRGYVLALGRVVTSGDIEQLASSELVQASFMGLRAAKSTSTV